MSLKDLAQCINIQNEAIKRLPPEGIASEGTICKLWDRFRIEFWGRDLESLESSESVQRGEDQVQDDILPEQPPPASRTVVKFSNPPPRAWILPDKSGTFLVRPEYHKAEKAALSVSADRTCKLFLVNGTPGIGKSIFLMWLLIRRLALKLPTILHIDSPYPILFHQDGVFQLMAPNQPRLYDPLFIEGGGSRGIWVLFDENPILPQPVELFRYNSPCFIVQAGSPCSQYHEWHNRLTPEIFYMNPWSFSEVIQAHSFLNPHATERQLWYLYHEFGASPRDLTQCVTRPNSYELKLTQKIQHLNPGDLPAIFKDPGSCSVSDFILTMYPSPEGHSKYIVAPASRRVLLLLWDKHFRSRLDEMEYFYDLFQGSVVTYAAAGWIFEFRMHDLLLEKRILRLFPIHCANIGKVNFIYSDYTATEERKDQVELELPELDESCLGDTIPQANCYYYPDSLNFPGIDSLLLIHPPSKATPVLLVFKITRSMSRHYVKAGSLRNIDRLDLPKNVHKYYVAVTPEGIQPNITIPIDYFPQGAKQKEAIDVVFPVFHCPVPGRELFPS